MPGKKEPEDPAVVAEAVNSSVLTEMVNNLEATKLRLLLEIKELKEKLDQQKEDQSDIYYYLNKKCDESFEVISSLEEQILNEQADREIAEKLYEQKIDELKAAYQSNDVKLTSRISDLENRLEMLNAFSETKDETEANLKNLMTKLEEERIQFSVNAESMENKFLMEREKLRKSYDVKYENIKKELELSVDAKLAKKTKKTQIMNIVMKKELDSQSKHAEKLLEINQNILTKDRELKLELDLSNSLQNEMTNKLAMYQRMIKQVNEKVVSQEKAIETVEQECAEKLHKKGEELIRLEARLNQMNKKVSRDNSKMDEMWKFLSSSYQLIKNKAVGEAQHKDHELLLVELIREIALKHPKALGPLLNSPALQPMAGYGSFEGDSAHELHSSVSSVVTGALGGVGGGGRDYASFATGIPSWDLKSESHRYARVPKGGGVNTRSVAVQTEGKIAPYPQGSVWLESSVSSVSRSLVGAGLQPGAGTIMRPSQLGDNSIDRSLEMHSVPTHLWGPEGAGSSMALTSSTSEVENYTVKSASYAMHVPLAPASAKNKALSKMRRNVHKHGHGHGGGGGAGGGALMPAPQFRDLDQILLDSTRVPRASKHLAIFNHDQGVSRSLHGSTSAAPSLGGGGVGGGGDSLLLTRPFGGSLGPLGGGGGGMAVSGQKFAAPIILPKL